MPAYQFSSKPQAVTATRKADGAKGGYREEPVQEHVNIMYDPRVYRGSTYSKHNKQKQQEQEAYKKNRTAITRRKKQDQMGSPSEVLSGGGSGFVVDQALPPVPGRKHMDAQTDTYLEELTDRVPETVAETQTDALMDRPSIPLFIPTKTGVDATTQVDVDELFDFDAEVEPILEVLVGKTLEHSMMEVLEEEELAALRSHQDSFEQTRNVERAHVQRLEAEAKRKNQERERRVKQEQERMVREAVVMDKVAARAFTEDYLADIQGDVFDKLHQDGVFYDPLTKEVEDQFLSWLINTTQDRCNQRQLARSMMDNLLMYTLDKAKHRYAARLRAIEEKKAAEEEERRKMEEERKLAELEDQQAQEAPQEDGEDQQDQPDDE